MIKFITLCMGVLLALPVQAQTIERSIGTAATNYALDGMGTVTRAYGFRRLLTSYATNKLIRLVRASDSTQSDIGFTATGALDVATATTFCNATTCKVVTMYDQSGNTGDATQATDGNRPPYTVNCFGTNPCARFTSASIVLQAAANVTPATGVVSFEVVANRSAGTGGCGLMRENGTNNRFLSTNASTIWQVVGGTSGGASVSAPDAAWHSGSGVINGANSIVTVDGVNGLVNTATGNTTAGLPGIAGVASTTCDVVTSVVWDNVALASGLRAMLNSNDHAWWMF